MLASFTQTSLFTVSWSSFSNLILFNSTPAAQFKLLVCKLVVLANTKRESPDEITTCLLAYANLQPGKINRLQSIKSSACVSGHVRAHTHTHTQGVTLVAGSFTMGDLSCGELMAPLISPSLRCCRSLLSGRQG